MIQRALESCFEQLTDSKEEQPDLEECILKITRSVIADPNKYLTYDFMSYLMRRLIDGKRESEAESILLDPKISVSLYPELWTYYIERQCSQRKEQKALEMIDQLKTKSIHDIVVSLYNKVLEKFVLIHQRTQREHLKRIVDHLISQKVIFTYQNQLEALFQIYQLQDIE